LRPLAFHEHSRRLRDPAGGHWYSIFPKRLFPGGPPVPSRRGVAGINPAEPILHVSGHRTRSPHTLHGLEAASTTDPETTDGIDAISARVSSVKRMTAVQYNRTKLLNRKVTHCNTSADGWGLWGQGMTISKSSDSENAE
jgi:hypothetical protein